MPEDIRSSLLRLQYEEPSYFEDLKSSRIQKDRGFAAHLKELNIPCGNGPPFPRCSWIPVIRTDHSLDPEHVTATLRFALATPKDVRDNVQDAVRTGMIVDATYVAYKGKDHLITVLCDQLMEDTQDENALRIQRAPGKLGRAVEQGARRAKVEVRHWRLVGGEEYWEMAIAEEQEWIRQYLGEDPGPDDDFRSGLENASR